jgi:hypothetical protein
MAPGSAPNNMRR